MRKTLFALIGLFCLLLLVIERKPSPEPAVPQQDTIIDVNDLPPDERRAFESLADQILQDAISTAVNKAIEKYKDCFLLAEAVDRVFKGAAGELIELLMAAGRIP